MAVIRDAGSYAPTTVLKATASTMQSDRVTLENIDNVNAKILANRGAAPNCLSYVGTTASSAYFVPLGAGAMNLADVAVELGPNMPVNS